MGTLGTLLAMSAGVIVLAILCVYRLVLQYRQQEPQRAAEIALVPLDVLKRRARNFSIAAAVSLILYGLLKCIGHSVVVATDGIEGYGNIRGFFSTTITGSWFIFASTLCLGATLIITGTLGLLRKPLALWLAAPAIGFDLMISFIIGLERFGPSAGGGFILVMITCLIPAVVGSLLLVALNNQMLVGLKTKLDQRARAAILE